MMTIDSVGAVGGVNVLCTHPCKGMIGVPALMGRLGSMFSPIRMTDNVSTGGAVVGDLANHPAAV